MKDLTVYYRNINNVRCEYDSYLEQAIKLIKTGLKIDAIIYEDGSNVTKDVYRIADCVDDKHPLELVEAFIECFGIDKLDELNDRYYGKFNTKKEFIDYNLAQDGFHIHYGDFSYLAIDYDESYDNLVGYGYLEHNGYYFSNY